MAVAQGTILNFEPSYMKMSILTASMQDLTDRVIRDTDPDRAIEDWLGYAKRIGVDNIQLSSALHPSKSNVDADAMLDPVADHLDLLKPFNAERAARVSRAVDSTGIGITEIGYFDDMLIADNGLRKQKHDHMDGVIDAATLLREKGVGIEAIVGFVGRNQTLDMDQNLEYFEEVFIPMLKKIKDRGLKFRDEQCPMPGWNTSDTFINNIGHVPAMWIELYKIADKHGVGDEFRVTYDASHALLMGQRTEQIFQYLKDEGFEFLIDAFHAKGQEINQRILAGWGYHGQQVKRGDRVNGKPHPEAANQKGAWAKMSHASHELPGSVEYSQLGMLQGIQEDWYLHQLAARNILGLDPKKTQFVIEHEYNPARYQKPEEAEHLLPLLQASVAYIRAIDQAAGNQVAMHEIMRAQKLNVQRSGYKPKA